MGKVHTGTNILLLDRTVCNNMKKTKVKINGHIDGHAIECFILGGGMTRNESFSYL